MTSEMKRGNFHGMRLLAAGCGLLLILFAAKAGRAQQSDKTTPTAPQVLSLSEYMVVPFSALGLS
jgi:hypothetical protein